jgi:hypothetical protein
VAPVQHLCLSLIALSAGAELHLPELRRLRKQVGVAGEQQGLPQTLDNLASAWQALMQLACLPAKQRVLGCAWHPAFTCFNHPLWVCLQVACITAGVSLCSWLLVYCV